MRRAVQVYVCALTLLSADSRDMGAGKAQHTGGKFENKVIDPIKGAGEHLLCCLGALEKACC